MDIQTFLSETSQRAIPLSELAAVAADRGAFGDDVISGLKAQIEQRSANAQRVLGDAEKAGRESLLASEQRSYDSAVRERGEILGLLQAVERRTDERRHVPVTQMQSTEQRAGLFGADEFRALVGNTGAGSYIAPDEQSNSFFDKLSAASVAFRSGIRVIRTERDALRVPRVLADPAVSWTSEGSEISPTDPNYDEIVATPRKIAALTLVSNELVADSNPSVLEMLEMQLARAMALKFDLAYFEGSATPPEIRGLRNVSSINTAGSPGGNGTAAGGFVNLDFFASALGQLEADNASASVAIMHPRTWTQLSKLKEQATGSNKPLLQDSAGSGSQGLSRSLYGVPVLLSSQLSLTESQGTSNDCSSIYVYDASHVVAVRRADLRIEVDRSYRFNFDQTAIRAILRIDVVHPQPKAINRIGGIRA
jgi:HK97 family phage major capsid protein